MVDSKENYILASFGASLNPLTLRSNFDLRVKGLRDAPNEAMPTQVRMDEREMNTLSLK